MNEMQPPKSKKYLSAIIGWVVGTVIINAIVGWVITNIKLPDILVSTFGVLLMFVVIIGGGILSAKIAVRIYSERFLKSSNTSALEKKNALIAYQCPKCEAYVYDSKPTACPKCGLLCRKVS